MSGVSQPPASEPNIILITIDTLRADYLGCYGNSRIATPAIDGLAREGTLFERAYAPTPMTPPSHASILTGTYPPTHGVRDFTASGLRAGFPTLAGILRKNGYSTAAFVSAYVLDSVWGLNQGFDFYYDRFEPREFQSTNPGNVQRRAAETIDRVLEWLRGGVQSPYFLWVHLYDPHHDYNPPEPFRARYSKDLYGGEVAYTDQEVGRLLQALKQRGEYAKTLVVVTSDHGEAFGEHGEYEHGFFIYDATIRVPLLIKLPEGIGKAVGRVQKTVELVDIAPTILQAARVPVESWRDLQGRGLLSEVLGKGSTNPAYRYSESLYARNTFGWGELFSYSDGRFKYIEAPRSELYDLSSDPLEKMNLYDRHKAVADSLKERLNQFRARQSNPLPGRPVSDPQRIEALRSLGYVAVTVPLRKNPTEGGSIDPKDRIQIFNKILLAMQASDAGALARSDSLLAEVIREDPELFIAHYSLGVNRLKAGDNLSALQCFDRARVLNPAFDLTEMNRATALARLGKLDEAIGALQAVLRQAPRLEAKKQLARLFTRKKDHANAIEIYKDILASRPQDAIVMKFLGIAEVEAEMYEEGAERLQQAIRLGAEDATAHNFLGIALANRGRAAEAADSYRKALAIKADYQQARLNLAFVLVRLGRMEEARTEFAVLCRQSPRLCEQYRKYFP